jgi:poly(3-hydroxybutyrate) depolymerase
VFDRRLPIAGVSLLLQLTACDDAASAADEPSGPSSSSSGGGGASSSSNGGAQAQGGSSQGGSAEGGSTQGGSGVGGAPSVFPEQYDLGTSAGCGLAATPGLDETLSVTVEGATRTYWRMIPNNYDPNQPHGLVVVLHGSGGSGQTAYEKFKLQNQGAGQFIFLYPDALPAESGEPRWETEMDSVDYAFFDAIVAKAEADLCIDRDRLFVTGFSLGARFTSMLGCFRGDVIRAIAPGAPGMNAASLPLVAETDAGHCRGEVGAWVFWGTQDPDHQAGAELVRDYYSATNGCDATRTPLASPAECETYDNCPAQRPVTWCSYTLNHQWPDRQNVDYNGQKAAMDFFKSFPTPYLP